MQASTDLFLSHTPLPLLMQVFGPPPIKGYHFSVLFCILTHSCLFYPLHLTRTSRPLSTKWFIFLACIWHRTSLGITLTSHVVKSIHRNSHTALLTFIREPPQFACLCRTESCAFVAIYLVYVLVCLRAIYSIHTMRITFGPLSTSPTKGTACATAISWPYWSFV